LKIAGAALLFAALPVWAESTVTQVPWSEVQLKHEMFIFLPFVVFILLLVFISWAFQRRKKTGLGKSTARQIADAATQFDFTPAEIARIHELVELGPKASPGSLFRSLLQFERCIDAAARHLIASSISPAQMETESQILSTIRKKLGFGVFPPDRPLISSRNMEIGQRGSVLRKSNRIPLIRDAVVTMSNEFFFRINYDPEAEDYYPILPGVSLRFAFARPGDGSYRATTQVLSSDYGILDLLHTVRIERHQQRHRVRVTLHLPVTVKLIESEFASKSGVGVGETIEATMLDISSGGLTFRADRSFFPGDLVSLCFRSMVRRCPM